VDGVGIDAARLAPEDAAGEGMIMHAKGSARPAIHEVADSARGDKAPLSNTIRIALVVIDGFTAVTAIGGGIALMVGLEGARFPREWLVGTPFSSYVIPGLTLMVAVGGSATVAAALLLRNPAIGALASVLAGMVLMGWIMGEMLILNQTATRSWVEAVYFAVGLTMSGLGLTVGRNHRRRPFSAGSERVSAT